MPDPAAARAARDRLAEMVPAAQEVTATTSGEPRFVDPGPSALETVSCPRCGADIELDWVIEAISTAHERTRFRDLRTRTPCCGTTVSLNDLRYHWPAGFACFVLDARDPNVRDLRPEQLDELSGLAGCRLRRIWTHV